MTTPASRNPTRLLCDRCGRTYWINELSVHEGEALCNECAGAAGAQLMARVEVEPTEAQVNWAQKRRELDAMFEQAWNQVLAGIDRPLGALKLRMAELLENERNQREAWRLALGDVSPEALLYWDAYRASLRELGPRPEGGRLRRVETLARDPTPAAVRVAAYWHDA